jgi:2-methylisocitrate lyase-like PEP mutase family enzyme
VAADLSTLRLRFRQLHQSGTFVMPNAWDPGSARILQAIGFEAIATTSSGFAASLGRMDQTVTIDELVGHVAAITGATDIPVSVDAEALYAETSEGIEANVGRLAGAGAAGISIEDFMPGVGLLDIGRAVERVEAAVAASRRHDLVVTARAENHLYGRDDLDDTILRLSRYRAAGADVLYAPGLTSGVDIAAVVAAVDAPVNCLLLRSGPGVVDLAALGVRRVSVGGALAFAAYGALATAARHVLSEGTVSFDTLSREDRLAAFGDD